MGTMTATYLLKPHFSIDTSMKQSPVEVSTFSGHTCIVKIHMKPYFPINNGSKIAEPAGPIPFRLDTHAITVHRNLIFIYFAVNKCNGFRHSPDIWNMVFKMLLSFASFECHLNGPFLAIQPIKIFLFFVFRIWILPYISVYHLIDLR